MSQIARGATEASRLGHVVGGVLQVLFQGAAQLLLFALQARRQPGAQALAGAAGQAIEARAYILPGLLQVVGQLAAVVTQALAKVGLQGGDRASGERNGNQHLHQKSDTKGNKHRPQKAAS